MRNMCWNFRSNGAHACSGHRSGSEKVVSQECVEKGDSIFIQLGFDGRQEGRKVERVVVLGFPASLAHRVCEG